MVETSTNGSLVPIPQSRTNGSIFGAETPPPTKKEKKVQASGIVYNGFSTFKDPSYLLGVRTELNFYQNYYVKFNGFLGYPRPPFPYQSQVERVTGIPQGPAHTFLDGSLGLGFKNPAGLNIFSAVFGTIDRVIQKGYTTFLELNPFFKVDKPLGVGISAGDKKGWAQLNLNLTEPVFAMPFNKFFNIGLKNPFYAVSFNVSKLFRIDANNSIDAANGIEVSEFPEAGNTLGNRILPSTLFLNTLYQSDNFYGLLRNFNYKLYAGFEQTTAGQSLSSKKGINYFQSSTYDFNLEASHTFVINNKFSIEPTGSYGMKFENTTYNDDPQNFTKYHSGQGMLGARFHFGQDRKNGTLSAFYGGYFDLLKKQYTLFNIFTSSWTTTKADPVKTSGHGLYLQYSVPFSYPGTN